MAGLLWAHKLRHPDIPRHARADVARLRRS